MIIECCRQFQTFTPFLYPFRLKSTWLKPWSGWFFSQSLALNENPDMHGSTLEFLIEDRNVFLFLVLFFILNSRNLFSGWCIDIVWRKLILVTLAKLKQRLWLTNVSSIQLQLYLSIFRKLQIHFRYTSNSLNSAFEVQNI